MQASEPRPALWWVLVGLSLAVGAVAGLGAIVFRAMIGAIHNLLFLGQLSLDYDANLHTAASPWGAWIIGVPVLGAIGVAFLVKTFAPEAKGHGVPEVMDAIYHHEGRIRPLVAVVKSLASALSIGSGGAVGREGPIIQIGSAFGSTLGQLVQMPARQRAILIGAGAGGGIAATFNTPIGGIVFAVELILPSTTPLSLLCVALSCATATEIGRAYFGDLPSFYVPALASVDGPGMPVAMLPWFAAFGLLVGIAAWLTTRGIYWFEDLFDALPGNYYTRHMTGMLLVGLLFYVFSVHSSDWFAQPDHYYVQGVGYATIMDILRGGLTAAGFLLLLAAAKLLATGLTLGSGASGGVFSPCMFIGAALGAGASGALSQCFPDLALNPVHFAIAGMAAMVGGTTGATLTATIMTFEMTRDYAAILPVVVTVAVASAVRQGLSPANIYTLKLLRRGHVVPQGLQARMGELRCRHVMSDAFALLSESEARSESALAPVLAQGRLAVVMGPDGEVLRTLAAGARSGAPAADPTAPGHVTVAPDALLLEVLRALREAGASTALVMEPASSSAAAPKLVGVISEREIARVVRDGAALLE